MLKERTSQQRTVAGEPQAVKSRTRRGEAGNEFEVKNLWVKIARGVRRCLRYYTTTSEFESGADMLRAVTPMVASGKKNLLELIPHHLSLSIATVRRVSPIVCAGGPSRDRPKSSCGSFRSDQHRPSH